MRWIPVTEQLPKALVRVWVRTDAGNQTTAYLKRDGSWFIFCRKISATNPTIERWRE